MQLKHSLASAILSITSLMAFSTIPLIAQTPKLLPQGAFDRAGADNVPNGWEVEAVPEMISMAGDNKNRWVQLRDGAVLTQIIELPKRSKTMTVSARMKLSDYQKGPENWHRARVTLKFLNNEGEMVGTYPAIPDLTENSDWVNEEVTLQVPVGATKLQLQPGLWGSKGLFEVDDITVKITEFGDVVDPNAATDAPWPDTAKVKWGSEPVQVMSPKRAKINLNGPWKFSPAKNAAGSTNIVPEKGWGYLGVPGNWRRHQEIIGRGTGQQWEGLDLRTLSGAWYERRFTIPADWKGRHISIDFQRVSTDATFWIDGKPAGTVSWPEGELDITDLVTAGKEVILHAFVVATIEEGEALVMMGDAPGQNWTAKKELKSAGIVGDVTLQSRPSGAFVSDVYILPSVRKKQLGLDIEVSGVTKAGPLELLVSILDENGKEAKRFTETVNLIAKDVQRVTANWAWEDPKLWDYKQPNLYTLRLSARGAGLDDVPVVKFGFRETWIEGRQVFLNGTPFRMRPFLLGSSPMGTGNSLQEAFELGYNFGEIWPESIEERSSAIRFTDWFEIADRGGMPISGIMPHMGWMGSNINSPKKEAAYRVAAERIMRRYRNHPSIIMWGTSGNMMGSFRDPAYIGTIEASRRVEAAKGSPTSKAIPLGDLGVKIIKSLDPTRPVFIHNGGSAGDIYTLNNYLNFIPLQEREEWLSNYAVNGEMPLAYVEFGTPVNISIMRGRNGYHKAYQSENWLTEFASIYLGNEAFTLETDAYRKRSAELFVEDQTHTWSQFMPERDFSPSWMKLQDLFISQTWRSWRTMGMSGGMVPWDSGYARREGEITTSGDALRANNSETLAWIAGAAQPGDLAAFTAKDHAFYAAETIRKQMVLLNDSRRVQKYSMRWTATLDNKPISNGEKDGEIAVGETLFLPIEFAAPATTSKVNGTITLEATIGEHKHSDSFVFRVWPNAVTSKGTVSIFDPEGRSTDMLKELGYTVEAWDGKATDQLLILGRNSLNADAKLPGDLKKFVKNGGRVLLSGHDPHWLRENMGMRVSYYQSRRVWPVGNSKVTQGLDGIDLRDWRGHSTLLTPRPDYIDGKGPDVVANKTTNPFAGWRWGNRGTVASAAIEKPHRSGWRPLMECEFDLAYSPLMELDYGKGRIVWSQLDLEDHAALNPAAHLLARQIVDYAIASPLAPRLVASYIGGKAGSDLLASLGVQFTSATALPASGLVVIGADATIADVELETFTKSGGKILFLARISATGAAGLKLAEKNDFIGSLQAPDWDEARGLSASDLRWRNSNIAWVATAGEGWEVAADGLLARRTLGTGVMVWSQIDPNFLPADEKTYFRFTRWRQTRALSQLLGNLGASFKADDKFFSPEAEEKPVILALAGDWRGKQIQRLDAAPSPNPGHPDPGISENAKLAVAPDFDDAAWQNVAIPRDMDMLGETWKNADGEAVFRKVIDVPAALVGPDLKLSLGIIDDHDDTYFNGVRIGGLGQETAAPYDKKREYTVPAKLVKQGANVIAVRVWDKFGGGGILTNQPTELSLESTIIPKAKVATLYHPDYREDFELGDEPYRYYNW